MKCKPFCHVVVFLVILAAGAQGVEPEDPDEVAPVQIMLCGTGAIDALFSSSREIRTAFITDWGRGVSDFQSSLAGISRFVNGTCDVTISIGPLSPSQAAPLVRRQNRTIVQIPFAVGSARLVHSWQTWEGDGERLILTPKILADVYQCNITHLDDPRIQALNTNLSLTHTPVTPLASSGSADASILFRHLAALVPSWRLGTDHAQPLPACVQPNATYADFLRNDTFYIGLTWQTSQLWGLPSVAVLEDSQNSTILSASQLRLPKGAAASEWSAFSPVGRTSGDNAEKDWELLHWDFLLFLTLDEDSVSRGYPVGAQIVTLGKLLLSENIQSQLPAFGFKPLTSLRLEPSVVPGYLEDLQSVQGKIAPDMPYSAYQVTEQLVIRGQPNFNPLMLSALKGYEHSSVAWQPYMEFVNTVDTFRYPKKLADMLVMDDAVMSDVLLAKNRVGESLVQVPFAMDAVVIAMTLPGIVSDDLCMDAETIADILQCRITAWDHRNISRLNPGFRLPAQPINVTIDLVNLAAVHALAKYLDRLAPNWELGDGYNLQWPSCVHLQNSLYGAWNQSLPFETNYTFGFQQATAYKADMPGDSIRAVNAHGSCVSPLNISAASLQAVNISAVAPEQWQNFTWANSNASDVYPMGMMGFLVWDVNSTDIGYEEGEMLKNITSWLLSDTVQNSMSSVGLTPTYQNATAQIERTLVEESPDVHSKPAGIPFNYTVTGCSSANGYNSFEAIFWRDQESAQGRPFLLDTTYATDSEALQAFWSDAPDRGQRCDFALVWNTSPSQAFADTQRRVLYIPIGFAPLPIMHNFEGIPDNALRLDVHALAGLYSCNIRSFDGYIQSINPGLKLPPGNITVVAMPRSGSSAVHLVNYIRQDPWWTEALHNASTWPACIWTTKIKPFSGRVSQLMLENPNSIIGFQPIGHFLTIQILTELAEAANRTQTSFDVHNPLTAVWNKVLNGMWKTGSALPIERSVMVQNAQGVYLATQPVPELDFPWDWGELPDSFTSPAWANIPDPVRNDARNAYPIGQMMWVVADADIGAKGVVHAKRMKSFLRYVETGKARSSAEQPPQEDSTDASYQRALTHVDSVVPLPPDYLSWAMQGINNLSYDALPPLPPFAAHAPAAHGSGRHVNTLAAASSATSPAVNNHVAIGVAVPLAAVVGLLVAGLLIWRREHRVRHSSMRSALAGLTLRGSESIPSTSQDLKLELDGKGEPLLLGQGSFGRVYKGRWNGVLVAVKVLNAAAAEVLEDFHRECAILERLRHPNIIKYFGTASNAEGQVMMVTEYMQGGDLGTALARDSPVNRRLGWYNKGIHIALSAARGLAYLHAQKVISFDVKPANVLLDRTGKQAKLADVGLAKILEHSQTMTNMRGTLDYMPPEMFGSYDEEGEGPGKHAVTQAVDVYSFGLVLWQIVTGGCLDKMQGSLRPPRVPEECPAEIVQLYTACLSELPSQRPKAADLVKVISACADAGSRLNLSDRILGRTSMLLQPK